MIKLLQEYLHGLSGKTIVEFGAGYHESFREDIAKNNHYIISDINLNELMKPTETNLDIRCLDACNISLGDSSVDVACSSMLVMHLDTAHHFSEVRRILKRNGVYIFAATGCMHNQELKKLGFDPHLDVDISAMLEHGARVVAEECLFEPFTSIQDKLFWYEFCNLDVGHDEFPIYGLTKHYLLFELSPDKKFY